MVPGCHHNTYSYRWRKTWLMALAVSGWVIPCTVTPYTLTILIDLHSKAREREREMFNVHEFEEGFCFWEINL